MAGKKNIKGIQLRKNQQLLTLIFADGQVTISSTEGNLHKAVYKLNHIVTRTWFDTKQNWWHLR